VRSEVTSDDDTTICTALFASCSCHHMTQKLERERLRRSRTFQNTQPIRYKLNI